MRTTFKAVSAEISKPFAFMFGGKAEFTIANTKSGNSYKYRIRQSDKKPEMFFVRFTSGNGNWQYAGILIKRDNAVSFVRGKKGCCDKEDAPIRGLFYAMNHGQDKLPAPMEMHHHGRCCCCGKLLTDKESVERGMGPVCFSRFVG